MVDLFYEPVEIIESLEDRYGAEMSREQSAFVCGLIKEYKPTKILELGVAAGGTTAIMMNCCKLLGLDTEIYSVDLMENYYRDNTKKTGYLIEAAKAKISGDGYENPTSKMYRGGIYLDFANDIGNDIDMVILDTTHVLPGEILDFLTCFPALHKGTIVVLHDIILNHLVQNHGRFFATKLLFCTVVADKIIDETGSSKEYPNIAAFMINDDTKKYIGDVFSALTITWEQIPEEKYIKMYKQFFEKNYPSQMNNMFTTALEMNKRTISKKSNNNYDAIIDVYNLIDNVKSKKIYIYGCGKYGRLLFGLLNKANIDVECFVVSDNQKLNQETPLEVKHISDIDILDEVNHFVILVAMSEHSHQVVKVELEKYNVYNAIFVNNRVFNLLKM